MIKVIKIGDLVYQNIEPFYLNEKGEKVWNIPTGLEELRKCVIDTINWLIGQEIKNINDGDYTKLSAANSKAIALIAKLISDKVDTSKLTETERKIWNLIVQLANSGYSDSELLLNMLTAVVEKINKYSQYIDQALNAKTVDELIEILQSL
jgi:hypothetical protein